MSTKSYRWKLQCSYILTESKLERGSEKPLQLLGFARIMSLLVAVEKKETIFVIPG